jgi:mono/diheme cytochrome c family protein
MKHPLFGMTAAVASLSLLTGCPAEEKKETSSTATASKAIFAQKCSGCHGANGGGGMGPALGNVEAKGDAFIKNRITNGSPEKGMPPFKDQLKPAEIDALVAYVKSL